MSGLSTIGCEKGARLWPCLLLALRTERAWLTHELACPQLVVKRERTWHTFVALSPLGFGDGARLADT